MGLSTEQTQDTIVAIATAPGRGAIALVRLSGADAFAIGKKHIDPWPAKARETHLCVVRNEGVILDHALVTVFPAPNSFTGQNTVEISTHGGQIVPVSVVSALISSGARQALPGEFTRRAILSGKLDILQAEAIGDLIDATSYSMQRVAVDQLEGGLSRRLLGLRSALIELEALIAYDVDFPEEDDGPIQRETITRNASSVIESIKQLLDTAATGELIREGALVVIAGPPNAGKSSLFNAIVGKQRAIVTEIPGTTRDALEAMVENGNWPLRLVDTAGLRTTSDRLELLGIEVSERYLKNAEVILACCDPGQSLVETLSEIRQRSRAVILPVRTKTDLLTNSYQIGQDEIAVSAETGAGLTALMQAVEHALSARHGKQELDAPVLTRVRHHRLLGVACTELEEFVKTWEEKRLPATVAAVHLRSAVFSLEEMIGRIDVEDVLDRLFSAFCVGK
ncbi:MAG TPA: tRNA uridine-5-carboxymethylaminomethyl(34) synthesis GTPase MnmE [Gemmatimonadaceae bacterium]|nr:tRNA uridine-5-carboxymethylaminomethyl(34) synthesis GTPase MnmE [Gemmatimonadaceae bacterium]